MTIMTCIRAAALVGAVALASGGAARGQAAGGGATCVATLTSYYGPQGQVDDAVHTLQALAAQRGLTFGQLAAMLAQHHGTVDQCLAVLGLPPT